MTNTTTAALEVELAALPTPVLFGLDSLPPAGAWPWPGTGLDPMATARGPIAGLPGCASLAFGLILLKLQQAMPDSVWQAIGKRQLRRAFNGSAPGASVCGGLQGSLLMMALVGAPDGVRQAFDGWFRRFAFPSPQWDDLYALKNTVRTVSASPVCQESRNVWEAVFLREAYPVTRVYDNTRCAKLSRDCARRAVEMINEWKVGNGNGVGTSGPP
jgi:hypothetical protein